MSQGSPVLTVLIGSILTFAIATIGTAIIFDLRLARVLAFSRLPRKEYLRLNPKAKPGVYAVGFFFMIGGWVMSIALTLSWILPLL